MRYNVKNVVWGTNGVRKTRKSHHINALDSKHNAHGYANPHQTAGAKLDQVCVALYDSTRTKTLATYAYPATEQTITITIVDKWPGTDTQLMFYANDKTINSNTTIEFSDVTIVGS